LDLGLKVAKEFGVHLPMTKTARAKADKLVQAGHDPYRTKRRLPPGWLTPVDDGLKKKSA
jgi:hypothetical protein